MAANPYQGVINWLRSPEGEQWSEERMGLARAHNGTSGYTLNTYGAGHVMIMRGFFSVKEQDNPDGCTYICTWQD